jgi:hypothetical protein
MFINSIVSFFKYDSSSFIYIFINCYVNDIYSFGFLNCDSSSFTSRAGLLTNQAELAY